MRLRNCRLRRAHEGKDLGLTRCGGGFEAPRGLVNGRGAVLGAEVLSTCNTATSETRQDVGQQLITKALR